MADDFDRWWAVWPKKVKKAQARDAFAWALKHFNGDGQLVERMIATTQWQGRFYGGAKWLPDPDRWLLAQRWEDEEPDAEPIVATAHERRQYDMWRYAVGAHASAGVTLEGWVKRQRGQREAS